MSKAPGWYGQCGKSLGMFQWKGPDSIRGVSRTIPRLSRALRELLTNINTSIGEAHFLTKLITVNNKLLTVLLLTRAFFTLPYYQQINHPKYIISSSSVNEK